MFARCPVCFLPVAALLIALAGCDGITTGEEVGTLPLTENSAGGYGPVTVRLTPDMSPVAFNFRAEHGSDPSEVNRWNSYLATLSRDGREVAAGKFNINHTGSEDSPMGAPYIMRTMLTAWPEQAGDYTLTITPTKPVEVKLVRTQIEVRRNVRSDDASPPSGQAI